MTDITGIRIRASLYLLAPVCLPTAVVAAPPPPQVGSAIMLPAVDYPSDPDNQYYDRVGPSMSVAPYQHGEPTRIIVAYALAYNANSPKYVECSICLTNSPLVFTTQSLDWATPCISNYRTDPMTAVSPLTGDLYVGGRGGSACYLQRLPYNQTALESAVVIVSPACGTAEPTGLLAMGPQPAGDWSNPETLYYSFSHVQTTDATIPMFVAKSEDVAPAGLTWEGPNHVTSSSSTLDPNRYAYDPYPVVILDGLAAGRLVVASNPMDPAGPVAEVTYSDSGGDPAPGLWADDIPLDTYGPNPDFIYPPGGTFAPIPGDLIVEADTCVAIDPMNPQRVYVVFTGRVTPLNSNLDLFVARSYDSGTTFLPANTVRITDAQVRIPSSDCPPPPEVCPGVESDEWMPTIAVDKYGGINIMFFRTQTPDSQTEPAFVDAHVRYARWANDAALSAGQTPFLANFASTLPYHWHHSSFDHRTAYAYHTLKTSGCYVYAAYSAEPLPKDPWRVYMRRIVVGPCLADMNRNGMINEEDLDLFLEAYVPGDPAAEMTGDAFVDSDDFDSYMDAYCEGCPTEL